MKKILFALILFASLAHSQVRFAVIELNGIDGKTSGAVTIGTTNGGSASQTFYPVQILVVGNTVSALVTPVTISVGTNSSSYNNLVTAALLSSAINGANLAQSM